MLNPHPTFVHFPIAWFITALGFDVACWIWRSPIWLDRVAVIVYLLAVAGAGLAVGSGRLALLEERPLSKEIEVLAGEHSEWAFFTLVAFVIVFLLRFESAWRDRKQSRIRLHNVRLLAFAAAAVSL